MRIRSASTTTRATTAALIGLMITFGATIVPATSATAATSATSATTIQAASASSTTIIDGQAATLSIRLTDPNTGAPITGVAVRLWSRSSSASPWTTIATATATTSSTGIATAAVRPAHNTQYEWTFAGNSHYSAVTSPITNILVAQGISITATRPSSSTLSIWGAVAPNETGQTVGLQRLINGAWRTWVASAVIKTQTMPNGRSSTGYLFHLAGIGRGTYVTRATRGATSTNAPGISPTLTIKIS